MKFHSLFPGLLLSAVGPLCAEELVINEFLASNAGGLLDDDGQSTDWVELWNPSQDPVSMEGYHLSDDPDLPGKWAFPSHSFLPGAYLVIFASGKDRAASRHLHTSFRIARESGGFLGLFRREGDVLVEVDAYRDYPEQRTDVSYGRPEGGDDPKYLSAPTPGSPNGRDFVEGWVEDTRFSADRGFHWEPMEVRISCETPGATIAYTLDGSLPTPRHGIQVASESAESAPLASLPVTGTTVLRAMAWKEGYVQTNVDTQTYFHAEEILRQRSPRVESAGWGHDGPDWEMDPEIVDHSDPEIRPEPTDLLELPTVSLNFAFEEFFGSDGIYIRGENEEIDTSVEFLFPEGRDHQEDGTVQVVGGTSPNRWKSDKLSLRLVFRPDLRLRVFEDTGVEVFDTLVLDARLNNVWHYGGGSEPVAQRDRALYMRDQYAANLHNALGGHSPHGRHVHLYLNGIYWGIHTLHERPDDNFASSYLGGDNSEYDSLKHNAGTVVAGDATAYRELHLLADRVRRDPAVYPQVATRLDIPDFIDYMLVNYYVGNRDWAHHNWYATYRRDHPEGRWRFHSWDAEKGLHNVNDNVLARDDTGGPTDLHHDLVDHEVYRREFADRAWLALVHGPLSVEEARHSWTNLAVNLDRAIRVESARWGDNRRADPYTRLDWLFNQNALLGLAGETSHPLHDYFRRRSGIVLEQFRDHGWMSRLDPPVLSRRGGLVDGGYRLQMRSMDGATIYYTTDGSDPRGRIPPDRTVELVAEDAPKRVLMPEDAIEGWHLPDYDDASWPEGRGGAGYERSSGYQDYIDPAFDFIARAEDGTNAGLCLRARFHLDAEPDFDRILLLVRRDDGFVAWINGTEVARDNVAGEVGSIPPLRSGADEPLDDDEATRFESFLLEAGPGLLHRGENVLAVQGLNHDTTSSDLLLWPMLVGERLEGGQLPDPTGYARVYREPLVLTESVRVRACSELDGDWSPLEDVRFLVGIPPMLTGSLAITTIHYHPLDPDRTEEEAGFADASDFEYLQLTCIGDRTVILDGLHFTDGIEFLFEASSPVRFLMPGESLILAGRPDAWRWRYGDHPRLVGPFTDGRLSNAGERIVLANATGDPLFSVEYQDADPWPESADGEGDALSLLDPASLPDPDLAESWIAVPARPGGFDSVYGRWRRTHFGAGDDSADPGADPDGDRLANIAEFFFGTDPLLPDASRGGLRIARGESGLQLEFPMNPEVPEGMWTLDASPDLELWQTLDPTGAEHMTDDDRLRVVLRITAPDFSRFYRLGLRDVP